jgi:hypothetical protein
MHISSMLRTDIAIFTSIAFSINLALLGLGVVPAIKKLWEDIVTSTTPSWAVVLEILELPCRGDNISVCSDLFPRSLAVVVGILSAPISWANSWASISSL